MRLVKLLFSGDYLDLSTLLSESPAAETGQVAQGNILHLQSQLLRSVMSANKSSDFVTPKNLILIKLL